MEILPFAKDSQVKTDALISFILSISIFLSNSSASLILSLIGVKVSTDAIKNIYDNIKIIEFKAIFKKQTIKVKEKNIDIQKRWNELEYKDYNIIIKEFKIGLLTAKKYINMSKTEIDNLDNITFYKKRKTQIDDYINIIYKMIRDDLEYKLIYSFIKFKGYNGNENTLNNYIYLISKNNFADRYPKTINHVNYIFPKNLIIIRRNQILKYILTINSKIKKDKIIEENIELIKNKYHIVNYVEQIFYDFHSVIMNDSPELIDQFVDLYEETEIKDFCQSIKKDIAPVKNAISYNISSGFVEGNNNKFKLIKRIVYGKSKLVNLFRKCYVAFSATKDDFALSELI